MNPLLSDTAPEIERMMFDAYREMSPERKWKNLRDAHRMARALHAAGMRHRNPSVSLAEIQSHWINIVLDGSCPIPLPESLMEPVNQEYQPVLRFAIRTLERLGIAYAIGGSVASSLHGASRMTHDVDVTVEPFFGKETLFLAAFAAPEFYVSPDALRVALLRRSTFNILHPATGYKIDLFIRKDDAFEKAAFERRMPYPMPDAPDEPVQIHTPEDMILFKLRCYRIGNEMSDSQWSDIRAVMRTQGSRLDNAYLDHWAAEIGVTDLLDRIRIQV